MSDKGRLRNALEKFLTEYNFGSVWAGILKTIRESDEIEFVSLLSNLLDVMLEYTKEDPALNRLFAELKARKHQVGAALLGSLGQSVVGGVSGNLLGVLLAKPTMLLNSKMLPAIIDPNSMLRAHYFKLWKRETLDAQMALHGFSPTYINDLLEVNRQRLDAPQLISLLHRYPDHAQEIDEMIKKRGWHEQDLDWLRAASFQFPSVQDWITFAVREATNEQRAKELDLDAGDYGIAQVEAEKAGLAPGYFPYYWRSHWVLPSVGQAMEFLHRFRHDDSALHFGDKEFGSLIQALDIAPIWHKWIAASSYNPITRVDIRRVLKAGKLSPEQVLNAHYKDGYSDSDADILTDWVLWEKDASMRDISLAKIEDSVNKGLMTELEAQISMEEIRIDPADIQRYIKLWAFNREEKRVSAEIDYLSAQYMNNEIDEQNLRSQLVQLGLTPNNVYIAITNLNAKRKRQITPLTVAEVYALYENNIIDRATSQTELEARGVSKINAERQMRLIDIKVQKAHTKELADSEKEQKEIAASAASTERQKRLAEISVRIAELNAETADLKVIAPDLVEPEAQTALATRLLQIKQEIAYHNLEKSKVNLTYAKGIA